MFSHKLYSVKKTKQINKASFPIQGACTVLAQWQSTAARACFHLCPACLSAIPSLMVIFNLFFSLSHLGQMEHALKHVFGLKLHSWLAFFASGMKAVRRHQGESSQEDILTHHCLRLFCDRPWTMQFLSQAHTRPIHHLPFNVGQGSRRIIINSWVGKCFVCACSPLVLMAELCIHSVISLFKQRYFKYDNWHVLMLMCTSRRHSSAASHQVTFYVSIPQQQKPKNEA